MASSEGVGWPSTEEGWNIELVSHCQCDGRSTTLVTPGSFIALVLGFKTEPVSISIENWQLGTDNFDVLDLI